MILKHIRTRALIPLLICFYILACKALKTSSKPKKFEGILQDVYNCKEANPAYAKNRSTIPTFSINVVNGKRYLSGNTAVIKPTPFRNFSGRTFFINNGQREMKMQLIGVSCKNVFARTIIVFAQIPFSLKDCMLKQGRHEYINMDLNKVIHALPNWHAPGKIIHQLQLVSNGATEFCFEVVIEVRLI